MVLLSTRFEPEIYIQKAEEDIRKLQIACSLAEPPWDGYCGLVEVTEEDTLVQSEDEVARPRQMSSSLPDTDTDGVAESRKAMIRIMQQIKDIAKLPQEIRSSQLHALTLEAFQAASKQTDSPIAAELLRLASFACPHTEAALKQRIELALKDPEGAAKAGAHRSESTEQPLVSTTRQQGCVQPQKSAAGTKVDAAAANEKFVAAKQLIRSKRLNEALDLLEGAFEACPPDRKSARDQIQRHISVVWKVLGQQALNKQAL